MQYGLCSIFRAELSPIFKNPVNAFELMPVSSSLWGVNSVGAHLKGNHPTKSNVDIRMVDHSSTLEVRSVMLYCKLIVLFDVLLTSFIRNNM